MLRNCMLVQALDTRPGDRVRFDFSPSDYTIEEIDTNSNGQICHHANDMTLTCCYHPGEWLWIKRRPYPGKSI